MAGKLGMEEDSTFNSAYSVFQRISKIEDFTLDT